MDKINFINQHNSFPVSTYTYDLVQNMVHLAGKLALLGGQNYILSGCTVAGNIASEGLIVINGEILPFKGGEVKDKVSIEVVYESDHYADVIYREAYIHRTAIFSDTGEYDWSDFVQVLSNKELQNRVDKLSGDVIGTVKEWAGLIPTIPKDYMLCDGRDLLVADYPELFAILRYSYGGNNDTVFKLPNCKGRVTVGYDSDKPDYESVGKIGGTEKVKLTEDEIPEHKHIVPWGENLNTAWKPDWGYPDGYFNDHRGYKADTDNDNTWPYTSPVGGNKEHENRQPFIVFAKIIKVK